MFFLLKLCPVLHGQQIKVLSLRLNETLSLNSSRIFNINIPSVIDLNTIKWTGYEKNNQGKMIPKVACMGDCMDPIKIAEHFSMLNLKLMKWRILPNLNLDIVKQQRCLLFGSGTLGCAIARSLIAWGADKITFIDYGHVGYSNPVRQSLFTHSDAVQNKFKAVAAAERLTEILPSVKASSHVIQIPMPGHPVSDSMGEKTLKDIDTIDSLIQEHDVLFLITDSRESRWLPTLLGSFYGKVSSSSFFQKKLNFR
jgi:ubiquitin-like modifier-activating enzyme ATG7